MARLNFSKVSSGDSTVRQFMNYTWGPWRYSGTGGVNTWAHVTLTIQSGGMASGSKLYPYKSGTTVQMSALGSLSKTFSSAYVIVPYKNLLKPSSTGPLSISSDVYASGFSGSLEFTIRCSDGKTLDQNYVYIWSATKNLASTGSSYFTNTTKLSLPEGVSVPIGSPAGRTTISNVTQTTAQRSAVVGTWGDFATGGSWSWYYGIGTYNISSGGSTTVTLKNLRPDTTYNWRHIITNNMGKSRTYTGTFRTLAYTAPSSSISLNSRGTSWLTYNYSTWGSNIDRFNVYLNGQFYTTVWTDNSNGTFTVSNLNPKTTYNVYIQPYTPTGGLWGNNSNTASGKTYPVAVSVSTLSVTNLLPFTATGVMTSSNASDTSGYRFELWNAANNVHLQTRDYSSSSTWNISGLAEETTYTLRGYVKTNDSGAVSAVKTYTFTTPADQASIFVRVNNAWRRGKVWIKISNSWKKSKKVYIKVNGTWRGNNNN